MRISGLDHVVLMVRDLQETITFYCDVLGMRHVVFEGTYNALHFGNQKINLHPYRSEYVPHADLPSPGATDLCFVSDTRIVDVIAELSNAGHPIEVGPVEQTGAIGLMTSVYVRDPDRNLVEIACYPSEEQP
jgi:catechol 2,3-dioxygenase-like lactoylglutathione lyase family enzyme